MLEPALTAFRHAWQSIRASAGTAVLSLTLLATGIAASTTVFSIVDAVILRSLPFGDTTRLMLVGPKNRGFIRTHTLADLEAWRDRVAALSAVAGTMVGPGLHVPQAGRTEYARTWRVTASLFDVLGARPALGSLFTPDNEVAGADGVVVISYGLWQRRFGGGRNVIGRTLALGDMRHADQVAGDVTVIGVMPPRWIYPLDSGAEAWIPLVTRRNGALAGDRVEVIGRLRDDSTAPVAEAQIQATFAAQHPSEASAGSERPVLIPFDDLVATTLRSTRDWLFLVSLAIGLFLLVACANAANLLLARGAIRERDLAVRAALGATPGRLLASALAEGLMVSAGATICGGLLAAMLLETTKAALPGTMPRVDQIALDARVWTVTVATALVASVLFSVIPGLRSARASPGQLLRGLPAAGGRGRWRPYLIRAEVIVVSALLVVSFQSVWNFVRITRSDLGFDRRNLVTFELPASADTPAVTDAVASTSGVESVAELIDTPPLIKAAYGGAQTVVSVSRPDAPREPPISATMFRVSPGYFETGRIPLVAGRTFTLSDRFAPVVILDDVAAERFVRAGADPIGLHLRGDANQDLVVIGVVGAVSLAGRPRDGGPQVYVPKQPRDSGTVHVLVRTSGPLAAAMRALDASLRAVLPAGVDTPRIQPVAEAFDVLSAGPRAVAQVMGAFGLVALLVGATGVYGVTAAFAAAARREMAIRRALGAGRSAVIRSVLAPVSVDLGIGAVGGTLVGSALGAALTGSFASIRPMDPWACAAVVVTVVCVGLVAALRPAFTAAAADPLALMKQP